jgi:5-methylcytosine-specific restriction protein A
MRSIVMPASVADHVVEHHGDRHAFWYGALQSLCASCHSGDKRIETLRGYLPGTDVNGEPTDRRHPWFRTPKTSHEPSSVGQKSSR